jgi:glycosyltransferase involved in cell wall biosynthesis
MFPQVSETFIANEILALERMGVALRVFSLRSPIENVTHECVRNIRSQITYLPDPLNRHIKELIAAQVSVAAVAPARYRAALQDVACTSIRERSIEPWKRLLQAGALSRAIDRTGVTHLHAHFAHSATYVTMLAGKFTGLPFSFSAHARDIYVANTPRLLAEKVAAATFVATCTEANRQYLCGLTPDHQDKIRLAYHGVDIEKFVQDGTREDSDPPVILSAGRLVQKKGFGDLLKACRRLRQQGLPFRCVIIGDGPLRANLERRIAALGLYDVVQLAGPKTQEELADEYKRATVFALPCKVLEDGDRDGIPNVLLEAMASGLPVVSTSVSGIPELIANGDSGLLVPSGNVNELGAALELLLADSDLRERLGARARAAVEERFDSMKCVREVAGLFGHELVQAVAR